MSVILQPQVAFPIVRQIANHLDSTTYYVQAVVRDASGVIIDTVNLASQGAQRYQTSWQVPADSSGQGKYVSITTSVYTDSGYTTKSESYGDEETTYLIFDRVLPAMRGGGSNLDAYTVRRIVKEELGKVQPEPIKFPKMRFDEVIKEVRDVKEAVMSIPEPEEMDMSPMHEKMEQVMQAIADKPVTEVDFEPVHARMEEDQNRYRMDMTEVRSLMQETARVILERVPELVEEKLENMDFSAKTLEIRPQKRRKDQEEEDELDVTKLAL